MKFQSSILFLIISHPIFLWVKLLSLLKYKNKSTERTILYLSAFYPNNAGYIYRVQKWKEKLELNNFEVEVKCALTEKQFRKYAKNGDIRFYIIPLIKRTWQIISSRKYATVIVRREILLYNDYGNLFLEKLLLKIHPNAILDFDDDISYAKEEPRKITSFFGKIMLENGSKFNESLQLYRKFIVGSDYLKQLVLSTNKNLSNDDVVIIPTCVDYQQYSSKDYTHVNTEKKITFGWIGSNGNLKLLDSIIPDLNRINEKYSIKLVVISGTNYKPDANFEIENLSWSSETQIDSLKKMDIGLMPLFNTNEDKGKCGFKLIQYMGMGIVSVASAVTINNEIITDREDGYLVSVEKNNWYETLSEILENNSNFVHIGKLARKKIRHNYSFDANEQKYVKFIQNLIEN